MTAICWEALVGRKKKNNKIYLFHSHVPETIKNIHRVNIVLYESPQLYEISILLIDRRFCRAKNGEKFVICCFFSLQ